MPFSLSLFHSFSLALSICLSVCLSMFLYLWLWLSLSLSIVLFLTYSTFQYIISMTVCQFFCLIMLICFHYRLFSCLSYCLSSCGLTKKNYKIELNSVSKISLSLSLALFPIRVLSVSVSLTNTNKHFHFFFKSILLGLSGDSTF